MSAPPPREIYTNGYGDAALRFLRRRTLATHGRFVEPLLAPGQHLLDLGCGPGTLTLELAWRIGSGGRVVGVDRDGDQFHEARAISDELPVEFRTMDAYRLDFPGNSFDGVFSHALFEHLAAPGDALTEVHRVLKPGGFVALRSPDWGGFIVHPSDDAMRAAFAARLDLQTRNGGHVYAGRHLGDWLRQAGFGSIQVSASYEIYDDKAFIVEHIASQLERDGQQTHGAAWRKWGENPHTLFTQAWFEAIAVKEKS